MSNNAPKQKIKTLFGPDQVRAQANVLLGSTGLNGAKHTVTEILGNSIDEAGSGFGDKIEVTHYSDGSISIRDYGRGVPLGWDESLDNADGTKGAWGWDRLFNTLYSSGKYDDDELNDQLLSMTSSDWKNFDPSEHPYLFSVGTHGVGATATQYASEFFEVSSFTGSEKMTMRFEKGWPAWDELKVEPSDQGRGTLVHFKPDDEVFTDVNIPHSWVENLCKSFTLTAGIDIEVTDPNGETTLFEANSPYNLFEETYGDSFLYEETFYHDVEKDRGKDVVVLAQVEALIGPRTTDHMFFNNMVEVRGGVHREAMNTVMAEFFESALSKKNIKVIADDYFTSLTFLINTQCNKTDYRGQTKDSLENDYVAEAIYLNLKSQIDQAYARKLSLIHI